VATRADKSRQEQTRADKSRQEQTRADKSRQEQTRADKSRQEQTKTDKSRQEKLPARVATTRSSSDSWPTSLSMRAKGRSISPNFSKRFDYGRGMGIREEKVKVGVGIKRISKLKTKQEIRIHGRTRREK
jgi:ATPase subunit of ABC transporter with duplicated ATPase domains